MQNTPVTPAAAAPILIHAIADAALPLHLRLTVTACDGDCLFDALAQALGARHGAFDVVYSKLVVLHIPFADRPQLWANLAAAAPGGHVTAMSWWPGIACGIACAAWGGGCW